MAWSVPSGEERVCAACAAPVRRYLYRFHPPGSDLFERCVGLAWCSGCRIYSASMVHIPRRRRLVDVLSELAPEQREHLRRSEARLVEYLDQRAPNTGRAGSPFV
ncbi:hypothetical protein ACIHFE_20165 [Streptomyces sp. NPDC052396]|uniref:hypothetical protein n=1 Tax=Streptomyces sp. NPDC052396 TaxID=3365689 RepID=UPI0037CEF53A